MTDLRRRIEEVIYGVWRPEDSDPYENIVGDIEDLINQEVESATKEAVREFGEKVKNNYVEFTKHQNNPVSAAAQINLLLNGIDQLLEDYK